jgi:hypothetical protein
LRENITLKIESSGRPSILQEDCIQKNISVWGINISLRLIDLREKKDSYLDIFKAVEEKILCLKFNLGAGCQSYRKIASRKIYQSGA